MKKKIISFLLATPAALLAAPPSLPPGAGVIEREIEQSYEGKPLELHKDAPSIEIDIPEERLSLDENAKVLIKTISLEGNRVVPDKEIQKWIEGFLGKELTIADIYKICQVIDQHYAEKGYFLTRAYPPPQDIQDGHLVLKILEGKIGVIKIVGNKYYSTKFIQSYFEPFSKDCLNYNRFLKALLLLNENTDLSAGVLFEKGEEPGTADLIVQVSDKRPIHLSFNENNYGRDLTTNSQLGGKFDWGNCLFYGDTLSVAQVAGFPLNALYFTNASYTVPVNTKGTSIDLAYLFSKFHIEQLGALHLRGESQIATFKTIQALTRTKTFSADVFGYFDYKQIQNFVLQHRSSYDQLRVVTLGGLIDHYNTSAGRDYLNMRCAFGIPNFLGGMGAVSDQSSRIGGGGRFVQLNLDYDRIQRIRKEWMFSFHTSGQWSPSKLTLPQQIYVGGASSVRGYPLSVILGDSGYYANVETRFPLPFLQEHRFLWTKKKWKDAFQLVGFFDTGGTFFNAGNSTFIHGTGFGLRILGPYTLSLSFDLGFPLNHPDLSEGAFGYLKVTAQAF
jgi:hemolysin activation/secretion protein